MSKSKSNKRKSVKTLSMTDYYKEYGKWVGDLVSVNDALQVIQHACDCITKDAKIDIDNVRYELEKVNPMLLTFLCNSHFEAGYDSF